MEINSVIIFFLIIVVSYLLTKTLIPQLVNLLWTGNIIKNNWQGERIPMACGIIIPFVVSICGIIPLMININSGDVGFAINWAVCVSAVYATALVGFIDDILGDGNNKGLKGHFLCLYYNKRLTTGVIKAFSISMIAFWVVFILKSNGYDFFINFLLLVLMVNFINLLDLRPGRALKGVMGLLCISIPTLFFQNWLIAVVIGLLLAYAPYDFQAKAMLGDTGSNSLGMITGLLILQTDVWLKSSLLIFLVLIHLISEKYSLSSLINQNRFLKWIDELGRS